MEEEPEAEHTGLHRPPYAHVAGARRSVQAISRLASIESGFGELFTRDRGRPVQASIVEFRRLSGSRTELLPGWSFQPPLIDAQGQLCVG
jgi:hypothetical protein